MENSVVWKSKLEQWNRGVVVKIMELNKEQKEIIEFGDGPLLIVAGAGTGKTTVITERIARLVKEKKADCSEILAVTFTDKAADEMEERVDRLLDISFADLWISTFHSFCERVLREEGLDIGLSTDFKIADQTSGWMLVRKNLDKFSLNYYRPLGSPAKFLHSLLSHFSRCKDQSIYPEDYLKHAENLKTNLTDLPEAAEEERTKEAANAYHTYQKLLLDSNVLDFGDLINYCIILFKKRPHILKKYQDKFKYILVDEFQDTNWAQYKLIKMLALPSNNLTVCADDDQSIYRWRGASYTNIVQFEKDFPNAQKISLIQNYRSTQNILDLAYSFIKQNNPNRLEFVSKLNKKLIARDKEEGAIEHLHFRTLNDEAQAVANRIIELLKTDKSAGLSDFAVLVRANDSANPFCRAFERAGIAYQFLASRGLYAKPIVLDIIAYFKLLDNYHESGALYRILKLPFWGIDNTSIMKINQYAKTKGKSVFEALKEIPLIRDVSQQAIKSINSLASQIEKHSNLAKTKNTSAVLLHFINDSGYLKYISKNEDRDALSGLNQIYKKIKGFEDDALDPSLSSFMEQLNLELESGEQGQLEFDLDSGPDFVKVMTIHSAKGLEFKYVFIASMVDKRFPSIERKEGIEIPEPLAKEKAPEGDTHIEEERRLCYVAMTRAKKGLFFTSADDYGGQRKKKPSRFLSEMGFEKKLESAPKEKTLPIAKKKRPDFLLPPHFSFSQISVFSECPLQYKYRHLLKVPTKGKAVFSFGRSMHNALYEFIKRAKADSPAQKDLFESQQEQGTGQEKQKPVSLEDFNKILKQKWIDEWYEDKNQQKAYYDLGKKIIKDFHSNFYKNQPEILKINNELTLELDFKLKIEDYIIKGRIDRVDKLPNGVKIVDYKTGKTKEKLYPNDKQQLLIYQIALEEIFGLNPIELSYYYLEDGKEVSFLGSQKDKEKQKTDILKKINEIANSDFEPTPGFHCQFCDFHNICEFAKR